MHLKVAAVQIESALGQVGHNLDKPAQWIERAVREGADLVFFPDCSLTGYSTEQARENAIGCDDGVACAVESCAREKGVAVGFGFIEQARPEDDARHVNSDASDASASLERRRLELYLACPLASSCGHGLSSSSALCCRPSASAPPSVFCANAAIGKGWAGTHRSAR